MADPVRIPSPPDEDELEFRMGQTVHYPRLGIPKSMVVGINRCFLRAVEDPTRSRRPMDSYVLEPVEGGQAIDSPWHAWRVVNVPNLGPHFFKAVNNGEEPPGARLDQTLSGEIEARRISADAREERVVRGTIITWKGPGNKLHFREVYDDETRYSYSGEPLQLNADND